MIRGEEGHPEVTESLDYGTFLKGEFCDILLLSASRTFLKLDFVPMLF